MNFAASPFHAGIVQNFDRFSGIIVNALWGYWRPCFSDAN